MSFGSLPHGLTLQRILGKLLKARAGADVEGQGAAFLHVAAAVAATAAVDTCEAANCLAHGPALVGGICGERMYFIVVASFLSLVFCLSHSHSHSHSLSLSLSLSACLLLQLMRR